MPSNISDPAHLHELGHWETYADASVREPDWGRALQETWEGLLFLGLLE